MAKSGVLLNNDELNELELKVKQFYYIRFSWSDVHGIGRGVTVPARQAVHFLREGLPFVAGTVALGTRTEPVLELFKKIHVGHGGDNCDFIPARTSLYSLPWVHPTKTTGELICEALWPDQSTYTSLPRCIARHQFEKLSAMGLKFYSAFESEFLALDKDTLEPISDMSQYATNYGMDDNADWLYDVEGYLHEAGIPVRTIHPEFTPGQFEFTFIPKFGIETLDDLYVYKQGIKKIAKKHGKVVTFMPVLFKEEIATGLHLNLSLWNSDNTSAFFDSSKPDNLSDIARYWIGGILKHLPGMTALSCPTVNCYRRLHSLGVPTQPDWEIDNRITALRVVNSTENTTRIEHRLPSHACNPYLATAAVIAAGIDGIENQIEPPARGLRPDADKLPHTLEEALKALEEDSVMTAALGKEFLSWFLKIKRELEVKQFAKHDMKKYIKEEIDAERKQYLETI